LIELSWQKRQPLVDLFVRYLFRDINCQQLKKRVRKHLELVQAWGQSKGLEPFPALKVAEALDNVTNVGYLLQNLKLWLLACADQGKTTGAESLRIKYRIEDQDKHLGSMLSDRTWKRIRQLARKYGVKSLRKLDRLVSDIAQQTDAWTGKFLNRKLLFIMRSQKIPLQDFKHELLVHGMRALYLMLPMFDNTLHALNIVKRAIRQRGLNLIQHYTTQKRATLMRHGDGFYSNTVSLESFVKDDHDHPLEYLPLGNVINKDALIDIDHFYGRLKSSRQRKLVRLLLGLPSRNFTRYLEEHRLLTQQDSMPTDKFLHHCFDYLGVSKTKGMRFIQHMQQHFADYALAKSAAPGNDILM
jgi:hypothetical protein